MTKRLLITIGDPAGVGPELALRTADLASTLGCSLGIIGSKKVLCRVGDAIGVGVPDAISIQDFGGGLAAGKARVIDRVPGGSGSVRGSGSVPGARSHQATGESEDKLLVAGRVSRWTGAASLDYVHFAVDAVLAGLADAIVTGPIHKEAWHAAGAKYPGHTELFAERAGAFGSSAERHCMMLAAPDIRCALATVHVGLADVAGLLTTDLVLQTIELAGQAVEKMIGRPPRVTVLGLNPHAGEGGLFGNREEQRIIEPAIAAAQKATMSSDWTIRGPLPPDTAFVPAIRVQTDVYICMYHDQGLIPLKALAFDQAVNVTLGLRIVRTSVDHGTALDIAWRGIADDSSMRAAIRMAFDLCGSGPQQMTTE